MGYDQSPHGLVEIFCTGCGRSRGKVPYQGYKTVSSCADCEVGDGFEPPKEWPTEEKFFGRDIGTTVEDLQRRQTKVATEEKGKAEKPARRRKWMTSKEE